MQTVLDVFSCRDDKIEDFLQHRAIRFERLGKCRTYLIIAEELFGEVRCVHGIVSIGLNTLNLPDDLTTNQRKRIDGFSARKNGKAISVIPCYVIGQLARASNVSKEDLPGDVLMEYALSAILSSHSHVGGRAVLVECAPEEKLITFYERHGFKKLSYADDGEQDLVQMIRMLPDLY